MTPRPYRRRLDDVLGLSNADDILTMPWGELRDRTQSLLGELGVPPSTYPNSQPQRALFTNRTLNLRSIQAIGYDMGAQGRRAWPQQAASWSRQPRPRQGMCARGCC